MNKNLLLLCFLLVSATTFCQDVDTTYTPLPEEIENQPGETKYKKSFYSGSLESHIFSEVMGYYKEKKQYERQREQNTAKLAILQKTWQEATNKPDTITDGWHNAVATDNVNFYKVVKALVKNNKVKRVLVENYIPLSFLPANEIRKAKTTLTLEKMNNETLEVLEVYFLYDLDEPVIVSEPIHAGYICLWSDYKDLYNDIWLKIDGVLYKSPFKKRVIGEQECFSDNMLCLMFKPGNHELEIQYPGPARSVRTFVIKPDMCLHYRIGKKQRATD